MLDGQAYRVVLSDPDPETATRVGWILTALLFLLGAVSIAGELLGWWNDLGEIGAIVGTLGSLVVGVATYQHGADRSQVQAVHGSVEANGATLRRLEGKADEQLVQLSKLDQLDRLDRLEELEKLDQLDELARLETLQVGQGEQTAVLEDIRDHLSPGDAGAP